MNGWEQYDLQLLTAKLDYKHITLQQAKLHALRLGYHIKAKSKEGFLREFARQQRELTTGTKPE